VAYFGSEPADLHVVAASEQYWCGHDFFLIFIWSVKLVAEVVFFKVTRRARNEVRRNSLQNKLD
jgi:hypothetical protein